MAVKKSFLVYLDWRQHLELLREEERGRLIMALFDYQETGKLPVFSGALQMAFSFIRAQIDKKMRNRNRSAAICCGHLFRYIGGFINMAAF